MNKQNNIIKIYSLVIISYLSLIIISSNIIIGFNTSPYYYIVNGLVFIINVILMLLYCLKKKLNLSVEALLFSTFIFISSLLTVFLLVLRGETINTYDLLNVFLKFGNAFTFIVIAKSTYINPIELRKFMKNILLIGLSACIFNMIVNFNEIINFRSIISTYSVDMRSFYLNRNSFGQILFFSFIANTLINKQYSKRGYLVNSILIMFNLLLTMSRGSILATLIFIVFSEGLLDVSKIRKNYKMYLLGGSALVYIFLKEDILFFVNKMFIRSENGLTGRDIVWNEGINLWSDSLFFGIGNFKAKEIISNLYGHSEFHSFFIETLVSGGIIELSLYIGVMIYVLMRLKFLFKYNIQVARVYTSSYIALIFYCIFESVSFLSIGYVDTLFCIFFISIPLLITNFYKRGEI